MLTPLNLALIQEALQTRAGLFEIAVILACFAAGWLVDRRVRLGSEKESPVARIGFDSVNRLLFPLTALALLYVSRGLFAQVRAPAFYPIAIPLAVTLALVRLCVYGLRRLFGSTQWRPTSERAIGYTVWGALLLYYLGVLSEIASILEQARIPIGKVEISVLDLGRDGLVIVLALVLALWASSFLEQRLLQLSAGDRNVRAVMAKIFRALVLLLAVLLALSTVGVDLTVLSVFSGAVGVGIGLGLQKLASNYIAGFTILLDRSVRLGDLITVDNRYGVVTKVTARYVVVRSMDGIEAIVPNETLIVTTVLNHSYSTKDVRMTVTVPVSYETDLDGAMDLMLDAARGHVRVLGEPLRPSVQVKSFGDSGIELELGFWVRDPENGQGNLKSDLNLAIWRAFKAHAIEIPFPRRDIRVIGATASMATGSIPPLPPDAAGDAAVLHLPADGRPVT